MQKQALPEDGYRAVPPDAKNILRIEKETLKASAAAFA